MPTGFEWIATLPPILQFALMIGVGLGIAAMLWGRAGYLAGKKEPPITAKDIVLTSGTIADMKPVRDIFGELKRIADAADRIVESIENSAQDEEIERRAAARAKIIAAEILAEQASKPRRAPRATRRPRPTTA